MSSRNTRRKRAKLAQAEKLMALAVAERSRQIAQIVHQNKADTGFKTVVSKASASGLKTETTRVSSNDYERATLRSSCDTWLDASSWIGQGRARKPQGSRQKTTVNPWKM